MRFTPSVVPAILAFTSAVLAAPAQNLPAEDPACSSTPTPTPLYFTTTVLANAPAATSPTDAQADTKLSKTQQVFLADLAVDRYQFLEDADFVFDFNQPQKEPGKGGEIVPANRKTMPALVGTGASMAIGRMSACGINTFHVHPRSAELQLVISGNLITEMTPENGVLNADKSRRVIRTELGPNMMTIFPMGSVHTQFNSACENAVFVAAFASEDSGTGQVLDETFALDAGLVGAVLGGTVSGEDIDKIRSSIPKSIAQGVDECLSRCGLQKRSLE